MTFWVSERDRERLRQLSQTADVSVSNLINRAIRRLLDDPTSFFSLKSHTHPTLVKKQATSPLASELAEA